MNKGKIPKVLWCRVAYYPCLSWSLPFFQACQVFQERLWNQYHPLGWAGERLILVKRLKNRLNCSMVFFSPDLLHYPQPLVTHPNRLGPANKITRQKLIINTCLSLTFLCAKIQLHHNSLSHNVFLTFWFAILIFELSSDVCILSVKRDTCGFSRSSSRSRSTRRAFSSLQNRLH